MEERAAADSIGREHGRARAFRLRLRFASPALYPPEAHLTFAEVRSLGLPYVRCAWECM